MIFSKRKVQVVDEKSKGRLGAVNKLVTLCSRTTANNGGKSRICLTEKSKNTERDVQSKNKNNCEGKKDTGVVTIKLLVQTTCKQGGQNGSSRASHKSAHFGDISSEEKASRNFQDVSRNSSAGTEKKSGSLVGGLSVVAESGSLKQNDVELIYSEHLETVRKKRNSFLPIKRKKKIIRKTDTKIVVNECACEEAGPVKERSDALHFAKEKGSLARHMEEESMKCDEVEVAYDELMWPSKTRPPVVKTNKSHSKLRLWVG